MCVCVCLSAPPLPGKRQQIAHHSTYDHKRFIEEVAMKVTLAYNGIPIIMSLKAPALECIFKGTWSLYIFIDTSYLFIYYLGCNTRKLLHNADVRLSVMYVCVCLCHHLHSLGEVQVIQDILWKGQTNKC